MFRTGGFRAYHGGGCVDGSGRVTPPHDGGGGGGGGMSNLDMSHTDHPGAAGGQPGLGHRPGTPGGLGGIVHVEST
jgi:hypothetical protein